MHKVLMIAYYFPPMGFSGVQRPVKFAKYLKHFDWDPVILTTTPPDFYAFDESLEKDIEGLTIYRTKGKKGKQVKFPSYLKQKIGRYVFSSIYIPDRFIPWKKHALKLGRKIIKENDIDVIWATAPPFTNFLVAKELSEEFDIPYVVDYRDTWIDNPFHYFPTAWHKKQHSILEESVVNTSEKIMVVSRHAKELLLKRYKLLTHEDIIILPHGYDPEDFKVEEEIKPDPLYLTITHSGSFQDDRSPKYLFKALRNFIKKNPDAKNKIRIKLVGLMRKSHMSLIRKYKLQDNINVTGYLPHDQAIKHLLASDILWLMLNDTIRTPGKLYEYFGANKPLLITAPDGNMKELAKKSQAALTTDSKDVNGIEEAISSYYKFWKEGILPKPNEDFIEGFDRKNLTGELSKILSHSIKI